MTSLPPDKSSSLFQIRNPYKTSFAQLRDKIRREDILSPEPRGQKAQPVPPEKQSQWVDDCKKECQDYKNLQIYLHRSHSTEK